MQQPDEPSTPEQTNTGTVVKRLTGFYTVRLGDGERVVCTISSKLRKRLMYPTADPGSRRQRVDSVRRIRRVDPVAIGDRVTFRDSGDGTGAIVEVLERRNALSRRASGRNAVEQTIVANVDQMVAMVSAAEPPPNWHLLDRLLANAELCEIPALVCLTKMDVAPEEETRAKARVYEKVGYGVVLTSALAGEGVDAFARAIEGRVSVFVGQSGVGKTTLLNALQPGLGLQVREVSTKRKGFQGRHTTSHLEMFDLDVGGGVVDTPGVRELAFWHLDSDEVADMFPEMRPHIGQCRFATDCRHLSEPDCAIKQAVESGEIDPDRYDSYTKMAG